MRNPRAVKQAISDFKNEQELLETLIELVEIGELETEINQAGDPVFWTAPKARAAGGE